MLLSWPSRGPGEPGRWAASHVDGSFPGVPQSMTNPSRGIHSDFELKPSKWSISTFIVALIVVALGITFGPIRFVYLTFGTLPWGRTILGVLLCCAGVWLLIVGARRFWREARFYAYLDDSHVTVQTSKMRRTIALAEIGSVSIEPTDSKGRTGWWVAIRDQYGQLLAEWDRNWYGLERGSRRRFDAFTQALGERVGQNNRSHCGPIIRPPN